MTALCLLLLVLLRASSCFSLNAPPGAPVRVTALSLKAPPAIYEQVAIAGQKKASNSAGDIFKMGFVSGVQIGLGAYLAGEQRKRHIHGNI